MGPGASSQNQSTAPSTPSHTVWLRTWDGKAGGGQERALGRGPPRTQPRPRVTAAWGQDLGGEEELTTGARPHPCSCPFREPRPHPRGRGAREPCDVRGRRTGGGLPTGGHVQDSRPLRSDVGPGTQDTRPQGSDPEGVTAGPPTTQEGSWTTAIISRERFIGGPLGPGHQVGGGSGCPGHPRKPAPQLTSLPSTGGRRG